MTFGWPQPIEEAFEKVQSSDAPLGERLQVIANVVAAEYPEFTSVADAFVGRLAGIRAGNEAPHVGSAMPSFVLPDENSSLISLEELLERAPVVIALHRGHWCPYCHLNILALAEIDDQLKPAQIVAISPETQRYTRLLKAETGAQFPFLTDAGAAYALSVNLAIWIDVEFARLIAESGCDVPLYNKTSSWILPMPAVFVVRQDGIISARHIDPDYRQRMETADLLRCVDQVR